MRSASRPGPGSLLRRSMSPGRPRTGAAAGRRGRLAAAELGGGGPGPRGSDATAEPQGPPAARRAAPGPRARARGPVSPMSPGPGAATPGEPEISRTAASRASEVGNPSDGMRPLSPRITASSVYPDPLGGQGEPAGGGKCGACAWTDMRDRGYREPTPANPVSFPPYLTWRHRQGRFWPVLRYHHEGLLRRSVSRTGLQCNFLGEPV